MEHSKKAVKIISYVAGGLAIISALMVTVLMIMSALGLFYPRKTKLILHTDPIEKIYDAKSVSCTEPIVIYSSLHDGHELITTKLPKFEKVGEYVNQPTYMIVDASGDDVTDLYAIEEDFGKIIIYGKPISLYSPDKEKTYDGTALISDGITIMTGMLIEGHKLESGAPTRLTMPGEVAIEPLYSIRNKDGGHYLARGRISSRMTVMSFSISSAVVSRQMDTRKEPSIASGETFMASSTWLR